MSDIFMPIFLPKTGIMHIPAKIRMMYYMPTLEEGKYPFVGFSREECASFLDRSIELTVRAIAEVRSLLDKDK